jgi:hypothetical protein
MRSKIASYTVRTRGGLEYADGKPNITRDFTRSNWKKAKKALITKE